MTPYEFIARLAALVPHPREHQLTYHGVLAPASPLRDAVVPQRPVPRDADGSSDAPDANPYIPWAELLKRVFAEDVLRCPRCGGRRHMISVVTDPEVVRKVLAAVLRAEEKAQRMAEAGPRPAPDSGGGACTPEGRLPMPPRQGRLDLGV
jgi:DNA-directed RNA polymerase subunit RPC12/RpoP